MDSAQGRCDFNIRNNRNQTPLQLAVTQGHTELVQLLVAEGADVNMEDEDGDTAMHVALLRPQLANVMLSPSAATGSAEDDGSGGGGGGGEGCDLSLHCRVRPPARSINTSAPNRTEQLRREITLTGVLFWAVSINALIATRFNTTITR